MGSERVVRRLISKEAGHAVGATQYRLGRPAFNAHTVAFPNGEIRGKIGRSSAKKLGINGPDLITQARHLSGTNMKKSRYS